MDIKHFSAGLYKKGYHYQYFVPEKINHSFYWTDEIMNELLEKASLKLGELNSFSRFIPDTDMFIMMHIFKEAVVSSRIEGTRTKPVISIKDVQTFTQLSPKAAGNLVKFFTEKNILLKTTNHKRNRTFIFAEYLNMFEDK
jgi:hypothetical protein